MSKADHPQGGLTRRNFLKTTGAVAGITMAGGVGARTIQAIALGQGEAADEGEQVFSGSCRGNCFQGCHINYKVRDGRVVATEAADFPDTQYNRICLKGHTLPQRIYYNQRLKYPLKRAGERGAGEWERISWDEAIDMIAEKWTGYIEEFGPSSIAWSSCAGNSGFTMQIYTLLQNLMGSTVLAFSVDNALFKGTMDTLGFGPAWNSNDASDLKNAKTLVLWGVNASESQIQQWHFMADAIDNGAKVICIDPVVTDMASKSDIHVPLRPGSDAALTMAMMNVVIDNEWQDFEYLKTHTVAPFLVKEDGKFLRISDLEDGQGDDSASDSFDIVGGMQKTSSAGLDSNASIIVMNSQGEQGLLGDTKDPMIEGSFEIGGFKVRTAYSMLLEAIKNYTVDYAAELCDISPELIYEITEVYTKNSPSWIYQGLGQEHYVNGHYNYICTATLAMLTGNLAKPGASCGYIRPRNSYNLAKVTTPEEGLGKVTVTSQKLPEIMETGKYGDLDLPLKSLYVFMNNYLGVTTERKAQLEAFRKLDFIVVADMLMSETAMEADLVLPVAEWAECVDVHGTGTLYPFLHLQEKSVEPAYEAKSDFDICCMLGERLGYKEYFDMTVEDFFERVFEPKRWEALKKDKVIYQDYYVERNYTYIHGEDGTYPTPTGRAQFYLENPGRGAYGEVQYGQEVDWKKEALPHWEPPHEAWPDNPLFEKYPLVFYQEHVKWRTHTQYSHVPWLREMDPEPVLKINNRDADERGIEEGDLVKVFNDRGYVVVRAVINKGLRPGVVNIPHGWQADQFIEGHYNDLTSMTMNPVVNNNNYNDCLVEVEKIEGRQ